MKLSKENTSDNKQVEELQSKNEEDLIEKTDKLFDKGSYIVSRKPMKEDAQLINATTEEGINLKLFQSRNNRKGFFEGIWKIELPNFFFKFSFKEKSIILEERTQTPICFLLEYTEGNYIDFYIQINDELNFPNEIICVEETQENGYKEENKIENGKDNLNQYFSNNYFDTPIVIDEENCVVDLTYEQEENHELSVLQLNNNSIKDNLAKNERDAKKREEFKDKDKFNEKAIKVVTREYTVFIKVYIVGYNFNKYELELNSSETQCFRINFTNLFIDDIKNDHKMSSIIVEMTIDKNIKESPIKYLGLINEGTTCYMNSLIQILNMLSYFKKSIFQVDISPSQYKTSKIYSMQKLFYDLMNQEYDAISTSNLIISFGWSRDQMLVQHDVQEFFMILAEIMEKELKGTKEENTFKYLFEGRINNMIKCTKVSFESKSEETFTDLQLTIKNCKDIYESFDKYTEEELMEGNDQYETESFGKQDAKKRIMFSCLPRVLILQLKRFEYNAQYNHIEKINDRLEYYETLNLKKYTTNIDHMKSETEYECHAVVIHVGSINGGHYYCYIQPEINGNWFKFNDESVTCVEPYEVFHNNFGGDNIIYTHSNSNNILKEQRVNPSNAYLLIYIRKDCLKEILFKINKTDVPKEMIDVFSLENEEREKEIRLDYRIKYFINVDILTKEIIQHNLYRNLTGLTDSIINHSHDNPIEMRRMRLNVHQDMTIETLVLLISKITHIPHQMIFLYKYAMINGSYLDKHNFQMKYINVDQYTRTVHELSMFEPSNMPFFIYLHIESYAKPILCLNSISIALGKDKEIQYNIEENNHSKTHLFNDNSDFSNQILDKSLIYYNPKDNNWEFSSEPTEISNIISDSLPLNKDKKILVFIKYPQISINSKGVFTIEMKLDQIYQMNSTDMINSINNKTHFKTIITSYLSKEFKEIIKDVYDQSEVKYFIEYSCMSKYVIKESLAFQPNYLIKCNQLFNTYNNDGICIIPCLEFKSDIETPPNYPFNSLRELIERKAKNELTSGSFDFVFSLGSCDDININKELNIKPISLNMKNSEEMIQKKIISLINDRLLSKILLCQGNKIEEQNPSFELFINKTQKQIITLFTEDNYQVIRLSQYKSSYIDHASSFPLLKYVLQSSHEIKFTIDLMQIIKPSCLIEGNLWNITICDEYSNPIKHVYFEKERGKTPEIILKENIPHDEDKYVYMFIIQHYNTLIAYDSIRSFTNDIIERYNKFKHEIRYQPYPKISYDATNKVFVCVYANKEKPISFPFLYFCNIQKTKIKQLKEDIYNRLMNNIAFMSYKPQKDKVRYYQCHLEHFSPINLTLITSLVDEQFISQIITHGRTINICVDLISSDEEVKINHYNGIVSNYLSISDKIN